MKKILKCLLLFFILSSCKHFIRENHVLEKNFESSYGDIPLDEHPDVDKWINYFTGRGREHMKIYLQRSSRYLPIMKAILKESGLPANLVYVSLIESGFSPTALSHANAVGYWQFIYGTGKRYGLRIDGFVDERRDFILATKAATEYFKDLYSLFGSWHLALVAYNAGEYRVNRAVLKHYNRDFWYLSARKALPRETRNYIPKLIAAIRISKDPQKYGFFNLNYQPLLSYKVVELKTGISLEKLSKNSGLDKKILKSLNPSYKGDYVPVYEKPTEIRVPEDYVSKVTLALNESSMVKPEKSYHYHYWYRVKKGDSLYKIALKNKTTVKQLRRKNKLGHRSLIRIGQKLKIPTRHLVAKKEQPKTKTIRQVSQKNRDIHIVQRGENLSKIATQYRISLENLKKLNNIQGSPIIYPNQRLKVRKKSESSYHLVRKGETLIGIAEQYKIPLLNLMEVNSLNFKSVLIAGRRLIIPKK